MFLKQELDFCILPFRDKNQCKLNIFLRDKIEVKSSATNIKNLIFLPSCGQNWSIRKLLLFVSTKSFKKSIPATLKLNKLCLIKNSRI